MSDAEKLSSSGTLLFPKVHTPTLAEKWGVMSSLCAFTGTDVNIATSAKTRDRAICFIVTPCLVVFCGPIKSAFIFFGDFLTSTNPGTRVRCVCPCLLPACPAYRTGRRRPHLGYWSGTGGSSRKDRSLPLSGTLLLSPGLVGVRSFGCKGSLGANS